MTRRAAAGFGRLLPLLLIAAAVIIVAGAALLAACGSNGGSSGSSTTSGGATEPAATTASGSAEPSASPSTPAAATTTLRLYFLRDGMLGVAERQVPHTTVPATAALTALLAGPQGGEPEAGLSTAIPAGTRLLGLSIHDGTATVDLSREFGTGDGATMAQRVAEVVYTLTRYSTVHAVQFLLNGQTADSLGGIAIGEPQQRADYRDLEPNIFVESPGVGADLSSPFTLSGTARVFEGSFQARLTDSSGRRIVEVVVQASRGAPGRGAFAKEVAFSTSAQSGELIVFDQSMEDGSRQDEVKIPVSFAVD